MSACLSFLLCATLAANPVDGNRLAYLDGHDIYYPHTKFPKLITPQWVGEDGVDAVVILAIDDMRDTAKYESYLRPILQRLKQIDGRAPVSIMTCAVKPDDPQLQTWLQEGVSLEIHTFDHPCPLLQGSLDKAKATYDKCVDLMFSIPNNTPVAYRMPCCDSLNTVSPRFYKEIFNKTSPGGKFLQVSSSVFQVYTADDPEIPRELLFDADGKERFRKYFPKGLKRGDTTHDRFLNYVENYPYPYVIDRLCWEFPCMTPSDWEANFLHQPNNPQTVADMKAALDITVLKQGVLNLVFHPHGWIQAEQINELIDHAVTKHGKKVKFLTFKEALERLNKNLFAGQPLRDEKGNDNGVRLHDLNLDGYLDVLQTRADSGTTLVWSQSDKTWNRHDPPTTKNIIQQTIRPVTTEAVWHYPVCIMGRSSDDREWLWHWNTDTEKWEFNEALPEIVNFFAPYLRKQNEDAIESTAKYAVFPLMSDDQSIGSPIIVVQTRLQDSPVVLTPSDEGLVAVRLNMFPSGAVMQTAKGEDRGLRFIDVDEDGNRDLIWSNPDEYGAFLFDPAGKRWSISLLAGKRGDKPADQELPPIVRADGTDNGFFVRDRGLHWINEDTAHLPNLAVSWDFDKLLGDRMPAAKTPRAAVESMRVRPGFTVELMAHEPMVMDPVAFQWGPDGKLWVAEMADYPNGMDGRGSPGGRVRFLEDTNDDGQYDKSTLFLDKVPFPNGVHPWKNGILVSAAPDIFFAADTDGDGQADVREVLYTGFTEGNQQHRVNGFTWGLDGWLYLGNGDSGGAITSTKTGKKLDIRGRDLRIHPETGDMEAIEGQTQFGRNRDDWGHWFGNNNSRPLWHYVLEDRYLSRNPHLAPPDTRRDVSNQPGNAPVFPASKTLTRFNDFHTANRFTSACSAIVTGELRVESEELREGKDRDSSDSQLSTLHSQLSFVSEPVHNLVHCELMEADGVTFRSRRLDDEQQSEFLASTDNWFRPTQLRVGPDGALWIADMYRLVIEHPQWIPQEWQEKLNVRAGEDKGRLWRVCPIGSKPNPVPRLDKLSDVELVAAMDSPNRWQRDMAQQLVIQRVNPRTPAVCTRCVEALMELIKKSKRPESRVQLLYTLDILEGMTPEVLLPLLDDPHPGVRATAIRLSEQGFREKHAQINLFQKIDRMLIDHPHPWVQLQLAASASEFDSGFIGKSFGTFLAGIDDPYLQAMALSSVNGHNLIYVSEAIIEDMRQNGPGHRMLEPLMVYALSINDLRVFGHHFVSVVLSTNPAQAEPWQWSAMETCMQSLRRRGKTWPQWLTELKQVRPDDAETCLKWLSGVRPLVDDTTVDASRRAAALRLYAFTTPDCEFSADWLKPSQPVEVQRAAMELAGRLKSTETAEQIVVGWPKLSPALRPTAREQLLGRAPVAAALLKAVAAKELTPADIDPETEQFLRSHRDEKVRQEAERVLKRTDTANRAEVVANYLRTMPEAGDAAAGREMFAKRCAQCHKLGEIGHAVGPDLASLSDKSVAALVTAVLDPNRAVEAKFLQFNAATNNGLVVTGLLTNETATSVTLLAAEAKATTLLRTEIDELFAVNKSLMPEGLEKELSPAAMADLIAFIRGNVPLPTRKTFPGNEPKRIATNEHGEFVLTPATCEIYGPTLVLEPEHGNLGWWSSADDFVVWTLDVPRTGRYLVEIEWACDPQAAGHRVIVSSRGNSLSHKVTETAGWEDYRRAIIGAIELQAGIQPVQIKPGERPLPALMDLKSVRLIPE